MAATMKQLEERLTRIEQELEIRSAPVCSPNGEPWWRQIIGEFEGDEAYAEAARLGAEWRRQQREP